MDNLSIWSRFEDIDPKFTKPITGKTYRGTSPNPHYVIRCLTEMFGPVGVGFGWIVEREEFTPLGDEVLHWCRISFWHTDRANTFDAYGQTKALMKTKNGMMVDEDAPKKSLTDAITKAASQIGVAANIFLGRWDDSRYVAQVDAEYRREEQDQAQEKRQVEQPKTLPQRVDEAATADDINALIPEIKALNNAAASRHLHSRALALGLAANKDTGTYQPQQVAA
jgi:hypothetical protein